MALQIANPIIVAKINRLAKATGMSKTSAVERAVDFLLAQQETESGGALCQRMDAILSQIDEIRDRQVPFDPLDWDEHGLPR